MDRRSLLQRALLLAGAALTPGFTAEALAQAAAEAPQLLDAPRFALLTAVADTIVPRTDTPGAVDVGVPKTVDGLLRLWASPKRRAELIAALDAIDKLAIGQEKRGFARLTPARRHAVLSVHDAAALKPPGAPLGAGAVPPTPTDPNYGRAKQEPPQTDGSEVGETKQEGESLATMRGPPVADPGYQKLKELIVVLYYITEPALTQELRYEHSPGEWRPSVPVTAETRPSGGLAPV
jgi:hypothetical protein